MLVSKDKLLQSVKCVHLCLRVLPLSASRATHCCSLGDFVDGTQYPELSGPLCPAVKQA